MGCVMVDRTLSVVSVQGSQSLMDDVAIAPQLVRFVSVDS